MNDQLLHRVLLLTIVVFTVAMDVAANDEIEFFERRVRPVLIERCVECHGPDKQESGLRLDSREAILRGGDSGPAAIAKKPNDSLLVQAIRRSGDIKMPPKKSLKRHEVDALVRWIETGLPWPASQGPVPDDRSKAAESHWAYQPVVRLKPPHVRNDNWAITDIDRFIASKLQANQLNPAPTADPITLIRRATFDLIGLPPTTDEVSTFLEAYQRDADVAWRSLIARLLASPHYGERQARYWLDIARYADNKGYVFFEQKEFPWAWTYRDWVIRSFNNDMPYDRFVTLQLAADQMDCEPADLAAMGYLTLGARFTGNVHDILDDRIDVVTRGLLGLTVTCARCHDHKSDPIPQEDYYSLYGVFRSSREPTVRPLLADPPDTDEYRKFAQGLDERKAKLDTFINSQQKAMMQGARERADEYLLAAHNRRHHPTTENFMLITDKGAINPAMLSRWEAYLKTARQRNDPVWTLWFRYSDADTNVATVTMPTDDTVNSLVRDAFIAAPPKSMDDVAKTYGKLLGNVDSDWQALIKKNATASQMDDAAAEALRQVLYGPGSPPMVQGELGWGFLDLLPDRPTQGEYKKLLGDFEKFSTSGAGAPPRAMVLVDSQSLYEPVVFKRGNPNREGPSVPRRFLSVLSTDDRQPFTTGSGRLDLANAITDPKNPLTARVLVNRIWQQHFGTGLVETASDFGVMGLSPSHPDLIDWLASDFVANGWSIKQLHRLIMTSAVYRQAGTVGPDADAKSMRIDSANRLLWKFPRRRLDFEAIRDSHLLVTGSLNRSIGGPPGKLLNGYQARRTIYNFVNRMDLPGLMRTFDFPEPAATSPGRDSTTVPQQALFFLNHSFVSETANRILNRADVKNVKEPTERINKIYRILFSRSPNDSELALANRFLTPSDDDQPQPTTWTYGYGGVDDKTERVTKFGELTHWTGKRWQAGPSLPDSKLGWVFHDRTGGHPASSNDRCYILRWTAPMTGEVEVTGKLAHRPEPGNGVRGRIVSSGHGVLGEWKVDQSETETRVATVSIKKGQTLDFVVDWQGHITHDEFEWPVTIKHAASKTSWDSQRDFVGGRVASWTTYVHALLMTNEFIFME